MSVYRGSVNGGDFYSNITQPVKMNLTFVVDPTNTNGLGVSSLKSNGFVRNVFMHTSQTPGTGNDSVVNPNPANGYALIQMKNNYNVSLDQNYAFQSPTTGSALNISGTGLTVGVPYQVASVGAVPAFAFTIAPVADVSGNQAGKYLTISDAFKNNYVLYNIVSGVGSAPSLTGALNGYTAIPVSFATGATAATIGAQLATVIAALNGSNSFTATGTTTVTVTSKVSNITLSPFPADVNTGFTIAITVNKVLATDWQSVGLFKGLTPTIGQAFFATAVGNASGTGTVLASGVSGVGSIEVIGNPSVSVATSSIAAFGGAYILLKFLSPTSTSVTTPLATAPTALTVVNLGLNFDQSVVTVDGL